MPIIFVIRPLSAKLSLVFHRQHWEEKAVIAFFGIRGLGSFYYLAFAFGHAQFDNVKVLWVTLCFTVLASIVLHGVSVTYVMRYLDRRRRVAQ
jgi:NhaP-type Na+/H+ or K+/H+ antiporter